MSNQEPQNQNKTKEEAAVEKRRRFIKGAGIAAPVVFSLANRSAFGAAQLCLSQQLSGNMSHVAGAGSCVSGFGPTVWRGSTKIASIKSVTTPSNPIITNKEVLITVDPKKPSGAKVRIGRTISDQKDTYKWIGTDFEFGDLTIRTYTTNITRITSGGYSVAKIKVATLDPIPLGNHVNLSYHDIPALVKGSECQHIKILEYLDSKPHTSVSVPTGTIPSPKLPKANGHDFTGGTTFNKVFGAGPNTPMRQLLLDETVSELHFCVAALLNAATIPNYVMTKDQVIALYNGGSIPPGYNNLAAFLASTMVNPV